MDWGEAQCGGRQQVCVCVVGGPQGHKEQVDDPESGGRGPHPRREGGSICEVGWGGVGRDAK